MNHENIIISQHLKGKSTSKIHNYFRYLKNRYSVEEITNVIAKFNVEIENKNLYIIPSKMNYESN